MTKLIIITLAILLSLFNPAKAHTESPPELKVGLILPLTLYSEYGLELRNGVELAKTHHPQLFESVTFVYEDSAMDGPKALSAYRKLVTVDSPDIIYALGGPVAEILAPLADRHGVTTFTSSTDPATAAGHANVYRFANSADAYGLPLANALRARGIKRVAMLITENPYIEHLYMATKKQLGSEVEFTELFRGTASENDFRPYISKIRAGGFDAVGVFLYPGQISAFYTQVAQLKLDVPTFGIDAFENRAEVARSGLKIEGAFFPNHDIAPKFEDSYRKEYGELPQGAFASLGYDLAMVMAAIATSMRETPSRSVSEVLQNGWTHAGVTGQIKFIKESSGDKYFSFPVVMRVVKGGSIVTVPDSEISRPAL